jgi:hypothetical protein
MEINVYEGKQTDDDGDIDESNVNRMVLIFVVKFLRILKGVICEL